MCMCVLQKWDVWGTGLNCDTQPLYLYFVLLCVITSGRSREAAAEASEASEAAYYE